MGTEDSCEMRSALGRVLPARCRRAYHNDKTWVRVAERFDISQPTDWYRLNRAAVVKEFPHDKEVQRVFKEHIWSVLESRSPENEWFPWLFKRGVPKGYWKDSANHGRYAAWLAAELQLVEPEDWYQLAAKMIHQNGGAGLLNGYYNDSPHQFVEQVVKVHLHPEHQWFPWLFDGSVPRGFWDDSANHVWYAAWLAVELQLVDPEDWYQLTQKMVHQNSGRGLLSGYYNDSPQQFVEEVVKVHLHPDREWIREWNRSRY